MNASNLSSADTSSCDTPIRPRLTNGDPSVVLSPTGSQQGATCCIQVLLYQRNGSTTTYETVAVVQTFTFDMPLTETAGGRWGSRDGFLNAPTLGLQVFDARVESISGGNVNWKAWTKGASSAAVPNANQ
jgi:hypothetical protein